MRKILFLCLLLMSAAAAWGEIRVTDTDGETLPYASVKALSKEAGALTDSLGVIKRPKGIESADTVVVSYPGYSRAVLTWGDLEARGGVALTDKGISLPTVTKLPEKIKRVVKGKKHHGGVHIATMGEDSTVVNWSNGYEFHAKDGKKYLLSKVGFHYDDKKDVKPMQRMRFRLQVYDMGDVRSIDEFHYDKFEPVGQPIYIDYVRNEADKGKFVYKLSEFIELPRNSMVAMEIVDKFADDQKWTFRSNVFGKSCWTKHERTPGEKWFKFLLGSPFFMEALEVNE